MGVAIVIGYVDFVFSPAYIVKAIIKIANAELK